MAGKCKDNFIGKKFHMLTVIGRVRQDDGTTGWMCLCECGNKKVLPSSYVRREVHKSCGCYRKIAPKLIDYASKGKTQDLAGEKFNRLTCVSVSHQDKWRKYYWNCVCDCGNTSVVAAQELMSGGTKSCGCLVKDAPSKIKHGHVWRDEDGKHCTKEYQAWVHMKNRCTNQNTPEYRYYGERGISVCSEWINDFSAFYAYIGDAPSPDHSIDRIDVNGNYEPGNVRWATDIEQARNKTNTVYVDTESGPMALAEACEKHGLAYEWTRVLVSRGLTFAEILNKKAAHLERLSQDELAT